MPAEYQLKLLNVTPRIRLNTWLGALGIGVTAWGSYLVLRSLYPQGGSAVAAALLIAALCFLVGIYFYHKAVMVPSLVSVLPTRLSVRDLRRGQLTLCVEYASIAAYRHQVFNGTEELRLTLRTGERVSLKSAANLDLKNDFAGMVREVERQLATLPPATVPTQRRGAGPEPITREKGFWEKPLATGLLLAATLGVGLLGWQVAVGALAFGQIVGALGVYAACVVAWVAARRRPPA